VLFRSEPSNHQSQMSTLNYSKWDNIELSDDEEFECHPNVDKASMVRWKQAEIYRVRRERNDKIDLINKEILLNESCLADLSTISSDHIDQLEQMKVRFDKLSGKFVEDMLHYRFRERDSRWREPEPIAFCEKRVPTGKYVQQVIDNTVNGDIAASFQTAIEKLTMDIEKRKNECLREIELENSEANKKLTSENMYKEVFNTKATPAPKSTKVIETIHSPTQTDAVGKAISQEEISEAAESDQITSKEAQEFAEIKSLEISYKYLSAHPGIVNQAQSDEILAEAFRLQMRGGADAKKCKQYIHQSLLLQYCSLLGKDGVVMFFKRMDTPGHSAKNLFFQDVENTYKKISDRVKVLAAQEKEEEELERKMGLARVDAAKQPDGSLALPRGPECSEDDIKRADAFAELPYDLQYALLTQDVDEINAALQNIEAGESERLMKLASGAGLIEIQLEEDPEAAQ